MHQVSLRETAKPSCLSNAELLRVDISSCYLTQQANLNYVTVKLCKSRNPIYLWHARFILLRGTPPQATLRNNDGLKCGGGIINNYVVVSVHAIHAILQHKEVDGNGHNPGMALKLIKNDSC